MTVPLMLFSDVPDRSHREPTRGERVMARCLRPYDVVKLLDAGRNTGAYVGSLAYVLEHEPRLEVVWLGVIVEDPALSPATYPKCVKMALTASDEVEFVMRGDDVVIGFMAQQWRAIP